MLPFIIGGAILATGAYLLNEAKEDNAYARRNYDREREESEAKIKNKYLKAQRKDTLDKLFKAKRAKQKIVDSIYQEIKSSRKNLKRINNQIKESKDILSNLFLQKRAITQRQEKIVIQSNINIIINAREKLFYIKDDIKNILNNLQFRLKNANRETSMVQKEINRVLDTK